MTESQSRDILLIEDSDEDFYITQRAFLRSGLENKVYRCIDGEDALNFLYHKGKYESIPEQAPRPSLILLDLNLPRKDGREVLKIIKSDEGLKNIPVLILSTSADSQDINTCYVAGANSYIQKPVDLDKFMKAIQGLKNYWFEIAIFPRNK
jgi:CheY-like chemotaxis protein